MPKHHHTHTKDTLGAALSALCGVHCAISVLVFAGGSSGFLGFWFGSEWVHTVFAALAVLFAVLSFPAAYREHRQPAPAVTGTVGIVLLLLGLITPDPWEMPLTVIGASMAATAHLWNRRLVIRIEESIGAMS